MRLLKFIFLLFPFLCVGQTEPIRLKSADDQDSKTMSITYNYSLPDSTNFPIGKQQLTIFCYAMNLSRADSSESNVEKIWLALTNPEAYHSKYSWARQIQLWEEHDKPLPAGWTLSGSEQDYQQRILLEGFFNPYAYALEVADLDKKYDYLDKSIKSLSAFRKLKESGVVLMPWSTKGLKAIEAFRKINDTLSQHGYSLLLMHPSITKKKRSYTQIQYSYFNAISVRKGYEKEVIRVYKLLGLKVEPVPAR